MAAKTKHNVKIYTTPTCQWCKKTKEFLKSKGVKYEEIDVSTNQAAAQEMIKKSGQTGVPVTDIDGKTVVGFDQEKLIELLGL